MEETTERFEIEYEEDKKTLIKAFFTVYIKTRFRPYLLAAEFVFLAAFAVFSILVGLFSPLLIILLLFFISIPYIYTYKAVKMHINNLMANNGSLMRKAVFSDKLELSTASSYAVYKFENITGIAETTEQFVLMINKNLVGSIPKSAFEITEIAEFRRYLYSHIKPMKPSLGPVIINILGTIFISGLSAFLISVIVGIIKM